MATLSIVIPCLNEELAIDSVIPKVLASRSDFLEHGIEQLEVIVVNDGSTDQTANMLAKYGDQIRVIEHAKPQGYGAALKSGFAQSQCEYIAFMDMDNTYPVDYMPQLLKMVQSGECELACGDRLTRVTDMPWTRQFGNSLFVFTLRVLYGSRIKDSCTGQRVFHRRLVQQFSAINISTLDFSLAMTIFCLSNGLGIKEIPIPYYQRLGLSKLRIYTDGPRFMCTILKCWLLLRLRIRLPDQLFA